MCNFLNNLTINYRNGFYHSLRIIAKKSLVLTSINHDSNIIRQNSSKLVKLMGGTAAKKTDMFFKSAKDRESEYENQFSKEKKSIKEDNKKESGGKSAGLGGTFGKLFGKMIGTAGSIASIGIGIGGFLAGIGAGVWALDKLGGPKKLEETFRKLINRHESLRTSFDLIKEEPVQLVHQKVEFEINYCKTDEKEIKENPHRAKEILDKAETRIQEIKKNLREGAEEKDFDDLGILLHGYAALQKVLRKMK